MVVETYHENDDVTFKIEATIDGVAQTPDADSAKVKIINRNTGEAILAEISANISGTLIYYKYIDIPVGKFRLFFTATFNSGEDERTGIIDFNVDKKGQ